jgi:hypothetical protein
VLDGESGGYKTCGKSIGFTAMLLGQKFPVQALAYIFLFQCMTVRNSEFYLGVPGTDREVSLTLKDVHKKTISYCVKDGQWTYLRSRFVLGLFRPTPTVSVIYQEAKFFT